MKKEIKIGSTAFELSANAYTPVLYRECFGRDIFKDVLNVNKKKPKDKIALAAQLIYVMVQDRASANKIDCNDVLKALPKLLGLWNLNIAACVESEKTGSKDNPLTFSVYLLRCIQLGLSIYDLQHLTVGMIFDLYTEISNSKEGKTETAVRDATQEDMNAF